MNVKLVGLAFLLLSSVAIAEQKMACEFNNTTDIIYLRGDGEDITWPWNDYITISESWSEDNVMWVKRFELKSDSSDEVSMWNEYIYFVNRYTGDVWVQYTSDRGEGDGFTANGRYRPATEKLF